MQFFQEMLKMLNDANKALDQSNVSEDDREYADQLANRVFEVADEMGGSILGDVDDQLINKAREIKTKLAK